MRLMVIDRGDMAERELPLPSSCEPGEPGFVLVLAGGQRVRVRELAGGTIVVSSAEDTSGIHPIAPNRIDVRVGGSP